VPSEPIGIAGLEGRIEIVQRCDRPPGVRRHFAEVSRLWLLGFDTARSLVESLEDLFGYHRALDSGDQTAAPLAARV